MMGEERKPTSPGSGNDKDRFEDLTSVDGNVGPGAVVGKGKVAAENIAGGDIHIISSPIGVVVVAIVAIIIALIAFMLLLKNEGRGSGEQATTIPALPDGTPPTETPSPTCPPPSFDLVAPTDGDQVTIYEKTGKSFHLDLVGELDGSPCGTPEDWSVVVISKLYEEVIDTPAAESLLSPPPLPWCASIIHTPLELNEDYFYVTANVGTVGSKPSQMSNFETPYPLEIAVYIVSNALLETIDFPPETSCNFEQSIDIVNFSSQNTLKLLVISTEKR
jgi:hypothetical protein